MKFYNTEDPKGRFLSAHWHHLNELMGFRVYYKDDRNIIQVNGCTRHHPTWPVRMQRNYCNGQFELKYTRTMQPNPVTTHFAVSTSTIFGKQQLPWHSFEFKED